MIFVDIESTHFELETALKDFDPNRVHNIAPVRDMEYFREEWKHSQLYQSVISRYLVPRYFHYIPIRGDGNCAYRATFFRYIELLICTKNPQKLTNLIDNIHHGKGIFSSSECSDFKDKYKQTLEKYLEQIEDELRQEGIQEALSLFHQMVLLSQQFDQGLIMLLRLMVSNFIREHGSDSFNGLPCEFIFDQKHASLEAYVKNEVMKMGEEAQDLAIMLLPVVLRIGIVNVMISNDANDGIKIQEYQARTDQTKLEYEDGLNFHNQKQNPDAKCITLFFRPGHYEILLENRFIHEFPMYLKTFQFMKRLGYNERGSLIKHMAFSERLSEENKQERVKLHCSHEIERNELIQNLKQSFEFEDIKPNIQSFFEKQDFPKCLACNQNFTFNDFQQVWPEAKFSRRSFINAKSEYELRNSQDLKDQNEDDKSEPRLPDEEIAVLKEESNAQKGQIEEEPVNPVIPKGEDVNENDANDQKNNEADNQPKEEEVKKPAVVAQRNEENTEDKNTKRMMLIAVGVIGGFAALMVIRSIRKKVFSNLGKLFTFLMNWI